MLLTVFLIPVGILAGLTVLLYLGQTRLIFPAGGGIHSTPGDMGWDYEDVLLPVGCHTTHGWFIPAEDSRGAVLISHGNAGTIADRLETAAIFRELGFSVFLYDYGGYGRSSGKPSEERSYGDIRAAWGYLLNGWGLDAKDILLFGRSLGGGPTCQLATEVTPQAVILESTFLSAAQLGQETFPFAPVKLLIRHRFDNAAKVKSISAPLLVVHSPQDDIIPFRHGQALFEIAQEPKQFLQIEGGHNEGFMLSGSTYISGLKEFLGPLFP